MITPELITFIRQRLSNGVSTDQIKQSLQSSNWSMDDINSAFDQIQSPIVPTPNLSNQSNTVISSNESVGRKRGIPWYIKIGLIVPPVMFVFIFIMFIIQTKGFKTGSFSVTINGASNPTLVQVQSSLNDAYPNTKINLTWNTTKNLETGNSENILMVMSEMKNKFTPEDKKYIAIKICDIYSYNNQQIDKLLIWSTLPRLFGIFPAESLEKQSIEERSCPDWINKPAKT